MYVCLYDVCVQYICECVCECVRYMCESVCVWCMYEWCVCEREYEYLCVMCVCGVYVYGICVSMCT